MTGAVEALAASRARDHNEEGIEMFVALERVGEPPAPAEGELGELFREYVAALAQRPAEPTPVETAQALEALAARHFHGADGPYLRLINFHNTTRARAGEYERQLMAAGERFCAVTEEDLLGLLDGRPWSKPRPGVLPVLYEGYRNSYEVALPLVERAGLRALFAVPSAFVDAPVAEQRALARRCHIGLVDEGPAAGRVAMTWEELRDAKARGHAVLCHTAHHVGIADLVTDADVRRELVDSRARMEEQLAAEVRGLAFLWGSPLGLDPRVDAAVRAAGYRYVVSNTKIQRLPEPARRGPQS